MAEKKTKVVVETEARGFEKTRREAKQTFEALDPKEHVKSFKALGLHVNELGRQLRGLVGGLKEANKLLRVDEGRKGMSDMRKEVERLRLELEKLQKAGAGGGAGGGGGAGKRGFAMGVLQGSGFGEYFPEQGFRANVAGRAVGHGARRMGGIAGAFGGMPFTGMQGFSQGLAGIPLVGGFLAGQMQNLMGAAHEALAYRQQQMGMAQFQGELGTGGRLEAARAANPIRGDLTDKERAAARSDGLRAFDSSAATATAEVATSTPILGDRTDRAQALALRTRAQKSLGSREAAGDAAVKAREGVHDALRAEDAARRAAAESEVRFGAFRRVTRKGVALGYNAQDAAQQAQQMLSVSGGTMQDIAADKGAGFEQALAAQRRFGIGTDVAGAFQRGSRTGAVSGRDDGLVGAIKKGFALGLRGSDLVTYTRQTAQALMEFDQTGIPLDVRSLEQAQTRLARAGLGGLQGARVGRELLGYGRRMGSSGPQTGADALMMRDLYGFRGGGIDAQIDAMDRAERGEMDPDGLLKHLERFKHEKLSLKGSSKLAQMSLKRQGINMGREQIERLMAGDPDALAGMRRQLAASESAAQGLTAAGLVSEAKANMDPAVKRQASVDNRRLAAGQKVVSAAQDFESTATRMTENVAKFSDQIKGASSWMENASKEVSSILDRIKDILDRADSVAGQG